MVIVTIGVAYMDIAEFLRHTKLMEKTALAVEVVFDVFFSKKIFLTYIYRKWKYNHFYIILLLFFSNSGHFRG